MTTLANPHDAFCKYVLGRPKLAGAFLEHFLPAALVAPLDLASLAPLPGSFVDPSLANHHSDLLFRVSGKDGAPTLVYVLFEHKSEPDRRTPLQLLRYMERIWDAHLKDGGRLPLPAILPIVIHQGPPAWPWTPRFGEIVDCSPGHARFVPAFEYQLVDLCRFNDEDMPAEPFLAGALLAMKHVRRKDLAQVIESPGLRIRAIIELPDGVDLFQTMLTYICSVIQLKLHKKILAAIVRAAGEKGEHIMRTIADGWIEEGFHKGMDKGLDLGRQEGLDLGIAKGLGLGRQEGLDLGRQEGLDLGIAKGLGLGRQEGVRQALAEVLVEDLELRFGGVPEPLAERIHLIRELDALKGLRRKLREAASIEECERVVASETPH